MYRHCMPVRLMTCLFCISDPNQQNLVEWKTLDDGDNFAVLKPKVFLLQRFRTDRMNFWNDKMRHLPKHHDSDDMQRDEL